MAARTQTRNLDGQGRPAAVQPQRCRVEAAGRRCCFPATIFLSGAVEGTCRLHYGAPGEAIDPVIDESERWETAMLAGTDVPLEYVRYDGMTVPGFPRLAQVERIRSACADEAARAAARKLGVNENLPPRERCLAIWHAFDRKGGIGGGYRAARARPQTVVQERTPGEDDE